MRRRNKDGRLAGVGQKADRGGRQVGPGRRLDTEQGEQAGGVAGGLDKPVGALVGYLLLSTVFNDLIFGILFASVAGIMVFISLDQLLPTAEKYGEHHLAIYGLVAGMVVMALSLLLMK